MNFPDPEDEDSDDDDDVYDGSSSSANNNGSNDKSTIDGGKRKNGKKKTSGTAGTTTTGKAASAGRNNDTLHEIEKMKKCQTCGNNDQSSFVLDLKNGDVICSQCGTVVSESIMHEGSQFRKFEGEQDRNHHGDAANPLYSNAHNMSTTLSGVQMTSGAGHGGWRSGGEKGGGGKNYETILRNAHAYTELNVSQFGKTDRRTRTGYKDRQKREAFINMAHTGDALNLHEAVVQRAKELFAGFRDDRELVQQFKGVIAACLCEAFEQLSSQGQAILKQQQLAAAAGTSNNSNSTLDLADALDAAAGAQKKSAAESENASGGVGNKKNNGDPALGLVVTSLSARAARRNELHNATMAGRGGILLDLTTVQQQNASCGGGGAAAVAVVGAAAAAGGTTNGNGGAVVDKPAPSWDLEDCRSWLLDASRKVAQQWIQQRQVQVLSDDKKKPSTASTTAGADGTSTTTTTTVGTIPSGTLEELEGQLVEHSFTLCEYLEAELSKSTSNKINSKAGHQQRVITPRVNNMAKLGIKWQHSHERGSGGKGGVGGSGKGKQVGGGSLATGAGTLPSRGNTNATAGGGGGKRAGQILILLTAKRLGSILNDTVSGEAIHKELRSVVGKQEARKLKERSEEASRQRLQQMQRKPWLQARAQMET
jgi:TFIIB zinc-binding